MKQKVSIVFSAKELKGVKIESAKKIHQALKQGRRKFGVAGASLSWQISCKEYEKAGVNKKLAQIGLEGEQTTSQILLKWMANKPAAVLLESVHIRDPKNRSKKLNFNTPEDLLGKWDKEKDEEDDGDEEVITDGKDTDHILVIGNNVLLIDSKKWKEKATYSITEKGGVMRSNRTFAGSTVRMKESIYLWLNYLKDTVAITGIVHIVSSNENTKVIRNKNWFKANWRLCETNRLIALLDDWYEKSVTETAKYTIDSGLIAQIAVNCVKPYNPYSKFKRS